MITETNARLVKALIAITLMGSVCVFTGAQFLRTRASGSLLEFIGAAGLAMLGVTHVCEGLHLLPWMRWGVEGGPGHYLNVANLAVGLILLPVGYAVNRRHA